MCLTPKDFCTPYILAERHKQYITTISSGMTSPLTPFSINTPTKHVEIDLHFVREKVVIGQVHVLHVPMTSQVTNAFVKGLPSSVFNEFRSNLNICSD
jgi:hypothetical protein